MCRSFLIFIAALNLALLNAREPAAVNISLPVDGMLIRANVPIFGSVRVPKSTKLKKWRLEYGNGPAPSEWTVIKEGTQPIANDPNEKGQVKWNPNKEPEGNITNWATGLGSYSYGSWRQNLNGLYTLRLVAEAENAPISEARRLVFVGEAIIRTAGGTATSADAKCRVLVAPYAFGGDIGRVVAIIKQVPARRKLASLTGVEDTRREARAIYDTIPADSELMSPIYRLYPNGLRTEPPSILEFEYDPRAMAGLPASLPENSVTARQFNPETKTWDSLKTEWFGTTARALLPEFAEPSSYVVLMRRKAPPVPSNVSWKPETALKGTWEGRAPPHSRVSVLKDSGNAGTLVGQSGAFRIAFELDFHPREYVLRCVPVEGEGFATETKIRAQPGPLLSPVQPKLSVTARKGAGDFFLVSCEDTGLTNFEAVSRRSLACKISLPGSRREIWRELTEDIPGTGMFVAEISVRELASEEEAPTGQATFSVLRESVAVDLPDTDPPTAALRSPSHPGFLFTTAQDRQSLTTATAHSKAKVELRDGAWRISGTGRESSARIVNWPIPAFPVNEWPLVGFTYRLFEDAPWQLLIRNGMNLAAYHFTTEDSEDLGLPVYARSASLIADGRWQYWQANLQEGNFGRVDGISFGSWVKTGYRRVDPGFKGVASQILQVRDIYIGKSYSSRDAEMRWDIRDRSGTKEITWWVDQSAESAPPSVPDGFLSKTEDRPQAKNGFCRFVLPSDGRWFFHLQAVDHKGNKSSTAHYPLFIYGTASKVAGNPPSSPETAENRLVWKQPDGMMRIPLKGLGPSLDSRSLSLKIHGRSYPVTRPIWDAGSETLTVDQNSFADGAPLGFHEEETPMEITGRDFAGKDLHDLPVFVVRFDSGFSWNTEDGGGRLKVASIAGQTWAACWEQPTAPWRNLFPGSANNTLVVMQIEQELKKSTVQKWLRPLAFNPDPEKRAYFRETLSSPANFLIGSIRTEALPVFDGQGKLMSEVPHSATGEAWLTSLSGFDNFATGRVRIASRKGRNLSFRIATLDEAKALLSNQGEETLRLDAWLPPQEGRIALSASGNRRLLYGDANDTTWRKADDNQVKLEAGKDWRRISLLLVPRSGFVKTPVTNLEGMVSW